MLFYTNKYLSNWNYYYYKSFFEKIYKELFLHLKIERNREISVVFIDNEMSQSINNEYRSINKPTDVISFAFDEGKEIISVNSVCLGEIFINVNKAIEQSNKYGHSKKREFSFLFIHGLLHILGYDHKTKDKEKIMFDLQKNILGKCEISR